MLRQAERLRNARYGQEQEQEAGAGGRVESVNLISYDDETEVRHHSSGLGTIQLPGPDCCPAPAVCSCPCLLPLLQFLQTVAELVAGQAQELGRMGLVAARPPQCLLQKRRLYFVQANPVGRKADTTVHIYYA